MEAAGVAGWRPLLRPAATPPRSPPHAPVHEAKLPRAGPGPGHAAASPERVSGTFHFKLPPTPNITGRARQLPRFTPGMPVATTRSRKPNRHSRARLSSEAGARRHTAGGSEHAQQQQLKPLPIAWRDRGGHTGSQAADGIHPRDLSMRRSSNGSSCLWSGSLAGSFTWARQRGAGRESCLIAKAFIPVRGANTSELLSAEPRCSGVSENIHEMDKIRMRPYPLPPPPICFCFFWGYFKGAACCSLWQDGDRSRVLRHNVNPRAEALRQCFPNLSSS